MVYQLGAICSPMVLEDRIMEQVVIQPECTLPEYIDLKHVESLE